MASDRTRPRRWASLAVLATTVAVAFGSLFYAYSVLITDRAAGGTFSTTVLSTAYSGFVLFGGVFAVAIGRVADRRGVRPLVVIGSILGAAGLLVVSVSGEPYQLIAASWLLMGPAGAMMFYEPSFVAVNQWFGAARRGHALALLTLVGGLAGPIFLPITGALVDNLEWRPTARILAVVLLVTGLAAGAVLPGHTGDRAAQPARSRWRNLAGDRRFVLFTLAVVLTFGSMQAVFLHRIAAFEEIGLSVAFIATWAGVASLLSLPGRFLTPLLGQKFGGIWLHSSFAFVLGVSVVLMVVAEGTTLMIAHFVLFGLAFGGLLPLRAVIMGHWYSGPEYGSIMGAQWSAAALSGAAGPWLVGLARDAAGSYAGPLWFVVGALVVASVLTIAAGSGVVRPGRHPEP